MSDRPKPNAKRLHVITWGCQMNVYDSGRMADVLAPLGYAPTETPDDADMVILNTCHIRDRAAEKVFSELGRLRVIKQAREAGGNTMVLAVAGCVAQAEGAEIIARAPYVDIVLGPQTYHKLPEMVARAARAGGAVIETDFPAEDKFDHLPDAAAAQGMTAFLTIQEGCDKFCSFCVVPYTRGAESSRPAAAVLAEARRLVAQLGSLVEQPVVWRTAHHYGPDALHRSWSEHEELIAAFARHDGAWAEAIMSSHILRAFHAYADAHRGLAAGTALANGAPAMEAMA